MRPTTLGVYQLFENHRRYVVPLYQRPYVWTREDQWLPLWNDIRDRAEAVLRAGRDREAHKSVYPHFLGAIVTSQIQVYGREVHAYDVIDGQQRLTTLQLFLAAFRDVVSVADEALHKDLVELTRNTKTVADEIERYKVWPTNSDRRTYQAVMDAGSLEGVLTFVHAEMAAYRRKPVPAEAYECFYQQIYSWVHDEDQEVPAPGAGPSARIDAIFDAVKRLLHVVEIALEDGDDPQMIFETLNARGVPLLPSDLVRNYIFSTANRSGEDADHLYKTYWQAFEDIDTEAFWKAEVTFGRTTRQRVDLFLYHFLTSVLGEDVSLSHLFVAFKRWWEGTSGPGSAQDGLHTLSTYAMAYRRIVVPDNRTRFGIFCKRLQTLDVTTLHPVLLHLLVERDLEGQSLDAIAMDLESYLVRRTVCRLTAKNLNRFFLGLLQELRERHDDEAHDVVRSYLLAGQGDSVRWPGDDEFQAAWMHSPAYRRVQRRSVAMVLEALDRQLRTGYQEGVPIEKALTVEHVMPQSWQAHWPPPAELEGDETGEERRDRLIHSFGNLTLLTRGLNAKVGNASYLDRRKEITRHTELRLNAYFHDIDTWDEDKILRRGVSLFSRAVEVWHHPGGATVPEWTDTQVLDEPNNSIDVHLDRFAAVLSAFSTDTSAGASLVGKGRDYRQVRIDGWPRQVHYEFHASTDAILVGVHVELNLDHPQHSVVTAALEALVPYVQEKFPGYEATFQVKGKNWRWLTVAFEPLVPTAIVAQAMRDFIDVTRDAVGQAVAPGDEGDSSTSRSPGGRRLLDESTFIQVFESDARNAPGTRDALRALLQLCLDDSLLDIRYGVASLAVTFDIGGPKQSWPSALTVFTTGVLEFHHTSFRKNLVRVLGSEERGTAVFERYFAGLRAIAGDGINTAVLHGSTGPHIGSLVGGISALLKLLASTAREIELELRSRE